MVAFMRALADAGITSVRGFSDPTARVLLPQPWSALYTVLSRSLRHTPEYRRCISNRIDVLPLRTMAFDRELRRALVAGYGQVAILGAGLDGRAHRLRELSSAVVFEVDHPASQALKRKSTSGLPCWPRALHYVSVDFERERLGDRLALGGHRADLPTVWIWEGVVTYLSDAALRQTLDSMAERSTAGSLLLVQYTEPDPTARDLRSMRWFTSLLGEPQIGLRRQATMAAELRRAGYAVVRDTNALDWAQEFADQPPTTPFVRCIRLAVAERVAA